MTQLIIHRNIRQSLSITNTALNLLRIYQKELHRATEDDIENRATEADIENRATEDDIEVR